MSYYAQNPHTAPPPHPVRFSWSICLTIDPEAEGGLRPVRKGEYGHIIDLEGEASGNLDGIGDLAIWQGGDGYDPVSGPFAEKLAGWILGSCRSQIEDALQSEAA